MKSVRQKGRKEGVQGDEVGEAEEAGGEVTVEAVGLAEVAGGRDEGEGIKSRKRLTRRSGPSGRRATRGGCHRRTRR